MEECTGQCVDGRRRSARALLRFALWFAVAVCLLAPSADAQARTRKRSGSGRGGAVPAGGVGSCAELNEPDEIWRVGMEIGKGGGYEESRACFQRYVQLVPDDARGFDILAEVCARMSDYPGSLEAATKAVELAPDAPESLFLKASALMGVHEYKEARRIFEHALEIDPFHVNCMVKPVAGAAQSGDLPALAQALHRGAPAAGTSLQGHSRLLRVCDEPCEHAP